MKEGEKVIRNWRMQLGKPFGIHLWFDPSVESVRLLAVPSNFICVSDAESEKEVDNQGQLDYTGRSSSVSGQAGSAESEEPESNKDGVTPSPDVPF